MNCAVITRLELARSRHHPEQAVLQLLQDKGAPVTGFTWLEFEEGYTIESFIDPMDDSYHYRWAKNELC